MAIRVLEETGLLPHLNPGVLAWRDFQRLKPVAPSMGMMLETTARRLYDEPGGPHFGSPDKDPEIRLRVLEDAGRCAVPFTTGILVGIGETLAERAHSVFAIRQIARRYNGIQEVIVQNFRAKPDTKMRGVPDAELEDLAATIAVARLVLGPKMRIQAPPNLVDDQYDLVLRAGIDDWGGISPLTPDHVNPERPWPAVEELAERTSQAGFSLRERLTIYPRYVMAGEPWLDPRLRAHVTALADDRGMAAEGRRPRGRPWQEPDGGFGDHLAASGRTELHIDIDTAGRTSDRRGDFDAVYGDWDELRARASPRAPARPFARFDSAMFAALRHAADNPGSISDSDALALLAADGPELEALAKLADDLRRDVAGQDVTYVVTRNINFTNVCYTGCRFCAFAQRRTDADAYTLSLQQVGDRAEEAWLAGATEVCMQGGIHPDLPGTAYFDLAAEVKRRCPGMHVHAFSPMEAVNGAARTNLSIRDWLACAHEAGVDSFPGTAAEILDDDVRWVLTKGKLPAKDWIEVITTAHGLGIPTTATIMYGHVDTAGHWVGHIRTVARIQAETGGFTEFVLLPFVHHNAPIYLAGASRPGPTERENRALHAVARLLLHGLIRNIQCSWVKLGVDGCRTVLQGGANDVGGTLMEETISRMAGSEHGSYKTISDIEAMVAPTGRPVRQRTTTYGEVPPERRAAALASNGVCASVRRPVLKQ
jgi:FO synthase